MKKLTANLFLQFNLLNQFGKNIHQSIWSPGILKKGAMLIAISLCIIISPATQSNAATITVTANTNWSALTGGGGPGGLPNSTDIVVINNNTTLTVNVSNAVCASITIGGGTNNTTSILSFNSGSILTVSGGVNINGSGNRRGSLNMASGGILRLTGAFTINNLNTFTAGTGTIEYNNAGAQTVTTALGAYNNVTLSGSGAKTLTGTTINGILSRQGTATSAGTSPTFGAAATLEYRGSALQTTGIEFPATFSGTGGVLINNTNGVTLNAIRTIGAASKLEIGTGIANSVFNDGGFQLTSTGTLTITSGTMNIGAAGTASTMPAFSTRNYSPGATVAFISGVAQTVAATTYPNLTFSGAGTKTTASGTLTVSENWSTAGGVAALNTNNSNITVTGDITGAGNITSGSGTISLSGSWTNNGTFTAGTGTVDYNGAAQTIANLGYNNLTFSGSGNKTTPSGTITVAGNWAVSAGTALLSTNNSNITVTGNISGAGNITSGSGTISIAGSWTNNGTFTHGSGTVNYNGAAQNVAAIDYNNLTFSGTGSKTTNTGIINVASEWNVSATALLNANNTNVIVVGNISGTSNITSGSGTISVAGSWSNSGIFTANTGTVTYNGSSQTIAPLSYYNLICNPLSGGTSLSGTTNVSNNLTVSASTLNLISHNLIIGTSGTITIASPLPSKMILASGTGKLRKLFSGNGSFVFPIGDNTAIPEYSPVTVSVTGSAYNSAYIEVNVANAKHPDNASVSDFLNRYWNITQSGITGATANITGTYVVADINGTETNISSAQLNGTFNQSTNPWIKFSALGSLTLTANSASLTDGQVSAFTGIDSDAPSVLITGGNVTVCPNVPVALSTNVTADGTVLYSWTPTTGLSSPTIANPTATVSTTTIFTVTITDGNGITSTDNTTITIDPGALAVMPGGITGNIITCDGATSVQYSVQPATNAVSYTWTLPAGATQASGGNTRIITVNFPTPYSTGTICVVSENACLIPSAIRCLTVKNVTAFTPGRILGSANICENATGLVYSTDAVNGATSYNWTLPTGMIITAGAGTRNITVDAGPSVTPGPLCVSVSNVCGTSNAKCINTTVTSTTVPGGITGTTGICANTNGLIYSVQPVSGATSYTWVVPTGFNIVAGQGTRIITVDIGASPVTGDVCVSANFSCGSSTPRCKAVSVNGPVPGSITGPANICAGTLGVAYSVVALPNAISYNWSFPTGITQATGGNTNAITVDIDSNYTQGDICVSITSVCGTSLPKCITVKDFSLVIPGGITGPNIVCQNALGINYSVQPVTGAVTYNWIVPPGIIITSGQGTRFLTVNVDNSFTVGDIGVQVVSSCSSLSAIRWNTNITTINPGMPSTITASPSVCPSTTVTFSVTALANVSSYIWTLPQGMSFTSGPPIDTNSVSVDVSAGFTQGEVCVRAVSSCNINGYMKCLNFTVVPGTPSAITGSFGVCPSATGVSYSVPSVAGATSYNWELPSGWSITSGAGTNSITANVSATFIQGQVTARAVNSCGIVGGAKVLNVSYIPATPGSISGPAAVCNGNTYIYSIAAVAGAGSYTWTLPVGVTFTSGPPINSNTISVDVGGAFTGGQICVTASTACGGPSIQRCFTVGTTPATPGSITGPLAVCQGATSIVYSIIALPGITNYNWIAPAGLTIISGQGTTSITVDIGGGFTSGQLCVEAENSCGDPGVSSCISLSTTPSAASSITAQANFCPGSTRTLTVSSVSGAVSYTWSLPSGLTLLSGQGTSTVTVNIDGGYVSGNVCVTAFTACNNPGAQFCETIIPSAAGTAVSITASTIACTGSEVIFSIPVIVGAGTFDWSVPTGLTILSGQGTPTITTSVGPGFTTGDVCVIASSGCEIAGSQYCQTFNSTPVTPGNITAPTIVCANDSEVIFSVPASVGPSSYLWTVPLDMSIVSGQGSNVIIASTGPGFVSGQVTVVAQSTCAAQSGVKSVTVGNSLGIPLNIAGPNYVCPNSTGVIFSVPQVIGAVSYNWLLPPDMTITSGINTNIITVSTGAIFPGGQISVGAVSACGVQGTLRTLNVAFNIGTPGIISAPLSVCPNTSGVVISVPPLANAASYNWYLPTGLTITAGSNTNSITVSAGPSFIGGQICVEAVSICAVTGPQRCTNLIYLPVQPGGVTGTTKGVCGQTLQYSVQPATGAATYTWTAPTGASITSGQGTRIVQVTFTNAFISGQLQVYTTNSCGNSPVRTSAVITGAPDKPTLITGLNSVCANQTAVSYSVPAVFNATTYNWSVPSGAVVASGQGTTNITVDWGTTAGNVSVTTTNTCGTSTATNLSVAITCRISSSTSVETNLSVYPNPAVEEFVVRFDAAGESKYNFILADLSGRVVYSKTITAVKGINTEAIDVRDLPRGAYILKVNSNESQIGNARVILQ